MNTAAAYTFDDTAPLQTATRLRLVTGAGYAANDGIYDTGTIQPHPLPNPLMELLAIRLARQTTTGKSLVIPQAGEGANVARRAAQTLDDPNGNRTRQIENNGGADETTTYAFDANDRLTTVNYPATATQPTSQTSYTFDANGNRVTEITGAGGIATLNKTYTYNNRNQLTAVADNLNPANSAAYTFDANGNQTSKTQNGNVTTFTYDVKDQLTAVSQNGGSLGIFSYDYQGHRIIKNMGGAIVRYAYDGNSVLLETDTSGATLAKFDYGPDRLLSMNHVSEGRAYYLFDALGSVANLTNTAGAIQARYQYDAFGNYRNTAGSSFNRFAFTGHEKDNETNLYYFKARYYDPDTGRFLNQDAYLGDINTPPSLHRYMYAYSNPMVYIDLTGYKSIFGDAYDQMQNFKGWLTEQNKKSDSAVVGFFIGTAKAVTSLGQGLTGALDITANLAQKAVGVDDQQVNDELGKVGKALGGAKDFVLHGDKVQAAKNAYQAAIDKTSDAMAGDPTAVSDVTEFGWSFVGGGAAKGNIGTAGEKLAAKSEDMLEAASGKVPQTAEKALIGEGKNLETAEAHASPEAQKTAASHASGEPCSFAAGTLVMTQAGLKPIESIKEGDIVLARNEATGEESWKPVLGTFQKWHDDALNLTLDDGSGKTETIVVTSEHPFSLKGRGWTEAGKLKANDEVMAATGRWLKVASITRMPRKLIAYNLEVDVFHTYFVGSSEVWVHNCEIVYRPEEPPKAVTGNGGKQLLPGELEVGTYGDLTPGRVGDNLTPHHMPSNKYVKEHFGGTLDEGISMMMEQPSPGVGGRHRATRTYGAGGRDPELMNETPRQALGRDIRDARKIYQQDGLYDSRVRDALRDVIEQNKQQWPGAFDKE